MTAMEWINSKVGKAYQSKLGLLIQSAHIDGTMEKGLKLPASEVSRILCAVFQEGLESGYQSASDNIEAEKIVTPRGFTHDQ